MCIRDRHKDARGFRPSNDYTKWFSSLPLFAQAKEWDRLTEEVKQREIDRGIAEAISIEDFKKMVAGVMKSLDIDRTTALRWLTQSTALFHTMRRALGLGSRHSVYRLWREPCN